MANITLSIPDDLHSKIRKHAEIRWSEVMRRVLQKRIEDLELMDKITSKSKLTKKDVDEISREIDSGVAIKLGLK